MAQNNGGGNARKIGRNSRDCTLYASQGRLAKNKKRTAVRHAKRMAKQAVKAEFRRTHNGMSKARFERAMKAAQTWQAETAKEPA